MISSWMKCLKTADGKELEVGAVSIIGVNVLHRYTCISFSPPLPIVTISWPRRCTNSETLFKTTISKTSLLDSYLGIGSLFK